VAGAATPRWQKRALARAADADLSGFLHFRAWIVRRLRDLERKPGFLPLPRPEAMSFP
jgi:hypothetical protein